MTHTVWFLKSAEGYTAVVDGNKVNYRPVAEMREVRDIAFLALREKRVKFEEAENLAKKARVRKG